MGHSRLTVARARLSGMVSPGRRDELDSLARQSIPLLLVTAATGGLVGLVVALFERITIEVMLDRVMRAPLWLMAVMPLAGLLVATLLLTTIGRRTTPATADVYLQRFHDPSFVDPGRNVAARLVASIATLGSGGAMGLEGPSIYAGSSIGAAIQRRFPSVFRSADGRMLLVAGAAAGVAAIFKAPATGAIFALEVPYQGELARRMLLPSLVASACGYLAFVAINDTDRLLPVIGQPEFNFQDLGGAVALGVAAGVAARVFAAAVRRAKAVSVRVHPFVRAAVAGAGIAGFFVAARLLTGESLAIGPGYDAIEWALDRDTATWVVVAMLVVRSGATVTMVAGGGVGGLFVPLVVAGALTGRAVGGLFGTLDTTLFAVVGIAAFLGAGYRVPLAAVMFVAETTGRPGFVVPGLLAAVSAELIMGTSSITAYQRPADDPLLRRTRPRATAGRGPATDDTIDESAPERPLP